MSTYGKPRLRRTTADGRIKALTGLAAATLAIAPVAAAFAQTGGATGVSGDSTAATSTSTAPAQGGATGVSSDNTAATTTTTGTDQTTTTTGTTTGTDQTGTTTTPMAGSDQTGTSTGTDQTGTAATPAPNAGSSSAGVDSNGTLPPPAAMPESTTGTTGSDSGTMSPGMSMPMNSTSGTISPGMNNGSMTYGNNGAMINGTGDEGQVSTTGSNGMAYTSMPSIDYTVLADPRLNYFDIRRAHAYGLSNQDIGCAYTLSRLTDRSMTEVLNRVEDGATFPSLAQEWGVPLQDVYQPLWDRDRIHEYMTAYNNTGYGALHKKAWNDWPGWVDWQTPGAASTDSAAVNGTGAPGIESPAVDNSQTSISSQSSSTTTTVGAPMAGAASNAAMPGQTITDVIHSDGRFTQLSSALTAAGLDSYLRNNGPFTVFAPTDAAFAKLPQQQLTALMQNPAELSKVLQYHLVGQNLQQTDMANLTTRSVSSIEGSQLNLASSGGAVTVNGANVTGTAIPASNGTIYAIDTVMMPPDLSQTSATDNSASPTTGSDNSNAVTGAPAGSSPTAPDTGNDNNTPAPAAPAPTGTQ